MMEGIDATLQHCLRKHLRLGSADGSIDLSLDLRRLGLDSMSGLALLLDLEKTFAIRFPDEMISPATFRTGETLRAAIRQLVPTAPA